MSRILARESVYKLIYEYMFFKKYNSTSVELVLTDTELVAEDKDFAVDYYQDIIDKYDIVIEKIKKYLTNYKFDNLFKLDSAVLICSVYELLYRKDVTKEVVINEAVEFCKKFSTEKSPKFVNGVLASVVKGEF